MKDLVCESFMSVDEYARIVGLPKETIRGNIKILLEMLNN